MKSSDSAFGTATAPSYCWRPTWNQVRCCWSAVCPELLFILNRRQGRTKSSRTCSGESGATQRSSSDLGGFRPLSLMVELWSGETIAQRHLWPDAELVNEGLRVLKELAKPASTDVLLATDLHAGNVLRSQREPWLVIDPKPFVGDRAYDPVQHLMNCETRLHHDPIELVRRVADLAEVDAERLRLWTFARAAADPRDDWKNDRWMRTARTLAL